MPEQCLQCGNGMECIATEAGRQVHIKNTIYETDRTIGQCKLDQLNDYIRNTLVSRLSNIIDLSND